MHLKRKSLDVVKVNDILNRLVVFVRYVRSFALVVGALARAGRVVEVEIVCS